MQGCMQLSLSLRPCSHSWQRLPLVPSLHTTDNDRMGTRVVTHTEANQNALGSGPNAEGLLVLGRVLVANRGEIAVRIIRAVHELGGRAVAIHPADDCEALHVRLADQAVQLPGEGVAAYLDGTAVIGAAKSAGCLAIHPGYGFLSENASFARGCRQAGIVFIGPDPGALDDLGDKGRARAFSLEQGVPVLPGTEGATTLAQAEAFARSHGAVMLKAVAGGGGRGMRPVIELAELPEAFERCSSEARAAFGNAALYVEKLLLAPRHIEVQVVGDGHRVQHLGERDCSVQRRHQKLIEVAPSPGLGAELRSSILDAALRLAGALKYRGLGTFEFLVDGDEFYFMEANPRLQVEHTITEEISGVDLVTTQLRLGAGATLADVGLVDAPALKGFAVQARVNLESLAEDGTPKPSSGVIEGFALPSGPGVRVDTYGYAGYRVSPRYDSLIAKVIGHGKDFATASRRAAAALAEFDIRGVTTNLDLMHGVLVAEDFLDGRFDTTYIPTHLEQLLEHRRPLLAIEAAEGASTDGRPRIQAAPDGSVAARATMSGVLIKLEVAPGDVVAAGATVAVIESMKMEHVMRAPESMWIEAVVVRAGDIVDEGALLAYGDPVEVTDETGSAGDGRGSSEEDWSAEVAEIERRRELAKAMGGPDRVQRQRAEGKLTARERIDALVDPGSFEEIGVLAGFGRYDDNGRLTGFLPANLIGGTARLNQRKVVLAVDDFTRRGGASDAARREKQLFLEDFAGTMRQPMVRLLDGQSGGGSVKSVRDWGYTYVPANPAWDKVVDNMSLVPVVTAGLGPTVGLGAARLVMSHLAILVEGVGQLFTAGPPVVREATGEDLSKEQLGGAQIHRDNGSVERIVADEQAAFAAIRQFLSYLPSSVYELPPVLDPADPPDRREDMLLAAVPRNRRRPYVIAPIIDAIFDRGSVFIYAEYGAGTVTALARLNGHPVGVIAQDPMKGATMSVEGAQAVGRLVDLCETFHLPIVSLTDQAGVDIGRVAEKRATIRAGARAISAVYQARVPQAELIIRRVYGVGGAGIVNRHRAGRSWAWPSGDWGSLPSRGGIEAAFRAEIAASSDPAETLDRLAKEIEALSSPFRTAERFGVQDIIDPRDSRALLCEWVRDAWRVLPELLGRPCFGSRP